MPSPATSNLRASPITPAYRWSERAAQYIDARGRFVDRAAVRDDIDTMIQSGAKNMTRLTQQYRDAQINVLEWRQAMGQEVKMMHIANAAAAKGGWAQMTQADWGRVGQKVRVQYAYLDNFAQQVASGEQRPDGTMLRRSQMYAEAGRNTYHAVEQQGMETRGYDEEANILDDQAAHCTGGNSCPGETRRGWVALGALIPIGNRACKTSCKCRIAYRNSQTGVSTN